METYYLNLIAKSYIKLTKKNDDNLALFYYKKSSKLERKNKISKNRFYNNLIKSIENLINNSYTKAKAPDLSSIPDEHRIDQENELKRKEFNYFAAMDQYSDYCAEEGLPNNTPNWEICTDATKLTNALNNDYVELKDPINIITPSKKISKKELIVRKSKLEYLKNEAIRSSTANSINELGLSKDTLSRAKVINANPNEIKQSKSNYNQAIENKLKAAYELIKPLGGVYELDHQLSINEINRLSSYLEIIIKTGFFPQETISFPKISLPNDFISKTIHHIYVSIGKKHIDEFIDLVKLFKDFEKTEKSTLKRKFSAFKGDYDQKLKEIIYT